jgi:hypothetical protein
MWVGHRRFKWGDREIPEKEVGVRRGEKGSLFTHVSVMAMNAVPLAAGSPANVLMSMALSAMTASIRYGSEEQLTWSYRHVSVARYVVSGV